MFISVSGDVLFFLSETILYHELQLFKEHYPLLILRHSEVKDYWFCIWPCAFTLLTIKQVIVSNSDSIKECRFLFWVIIDFFIMLAYLSPWFVYLLEHLEIIELIIRVLIAKMLKLRWLDERFCKFKILLAIIFKVS